MKTVLLLLAFFLPSVLWAQKDFSVTVHEIADPDGFNPLTSSSANAYYMQGNVFQSLLDYDRQTLALKPVLAKEMPVVQLLEEGPYKGGMSISYEIHPDAVWDNGQPVTAYDYVFTVKAIKNPSTHASYLRTYFEFIEAIVIDENNEKKFTIYFHQIHFKGVEMTGQEVFVLPEYHYDPKQLMRAFSWEELNDEEQLKALRDHPNMRAFAETFNSSEYAHEAHNIVGSGPYILQKWEIGQSVVFKRKKNWWGDRVENNDLLAAYPTEIHYQINSDLREAIAQAKNGEIDLLREISPYTFTELERERSFTRRFRLCSSPQFAYHYVGLNTTIPKLQDVRVRKAIAHALDVDLIVATVFDGHATKTIGPISPLKDYYNSEVKAVELDLEKARAYLAEAGWTDSDGDGVLDKMIDGTLEPLELTFLYNQGNTTRKHIAILLKENLQRIGINLIIEPVDFMTLLTAAMEQDFELLALAWVKTAGLDDLRMVWHREGASSRVGFGDEASDAMIEEIQVTLEEEKRKELYLALQSKIADTQCYIFVAVPHSLLAISKKFHYPEPSPIRPAYVARFFRLKR